MDSGELPRPNTQDSRKVMSTTVGFRTSSQQVRLWRLRAYPRWPQVARCAIAIDGVLNDARLTDSLAAVVRRYEILRTRFLLHPSPGPVQVVTEQGPAWSSAVDLSAMGADDRAARLAARLDELTYRADDLGPGPPLRVQLFRLATDRHILLLALPALCADAQTLALLMSDIGQTYEGRGDANSTGGEPIQYADYAAWQAEWIGSSEAQVGRNHWLQHRRSTEADLLPFSRRRVSDGAHPPRACVVPLPADLSRGITQLARRVDVSESSIFLACWQILLWRYLDERSLVVGLACEGRDHDELKDALGPYSCVVPLVVDLDNEPSRPFHEYVRWVDSAARRARVFSDKHIQDPYDRSGTDRDRRFSFGFEMLDVRQEFFGENIHLSFHSLDVWSEPFQAQLVCRCHDRGQFFTIRYDAEAFDFGLDWLADGMHVLLADAMHRPETGVDRLRILDERWRGMILGRWNDTAAPYPDSGVHELIEAQCRRAPREIAILCGDESLSYAELEHRAARLAGLLCGRGIGPETRVGVCVERSAAMVVAVLGILKAGGVYVPLDPDLPRHRLLQILADADPSLIVTTRQAAWAIEVDRFPWLLLEDSANGGDHDTSRPRRHVRPEHPAYVLYTSGSTGRPKGVVITHRALINFLWAMRDQCGIGPSDVLLAVTPLSFDIAGLELFLPLLVGGRVVIAPRTEMGDGGRLLELIRRHSVSAMQATPSMWRLLLSASWAGGEGLKAFVGGEPLPPDLARSVRERVGSLLNLYGPTETTIWSMAHSVEHQGPAPNGDPDGRAGEGVVPRAVPIGRPIQNTRVYVLDPRMEPVPIGLSGELYIGGDGLARCYLNQAGLTAERFLPDPFCGESGRRMYRTGDRVRHRPDGVIESSAASTIRSRSAATASNSARSRRSWPGTRPWSGPSQLPARTANMTAAWWPSSSRGPARTWTPWRSATT
jgi:amino acid adenylation domain-containing protein